MNVYNIEGNKYYRRLVSPYLYHAPYTNNYYNVYLPDEYHQPIGSLNYSRLVPTFRSIAKKIINIIRFIRITEKQRKTNFEKIIEN